MELVVTIHFRDVLRLLHFFFLLLVFDVIVFVFRMSGLMSYSGSLIHGPITGTAVVNTGQISGDNSGPKHLGNVVFNKSPAVQHDNANDMPAVPFFIPGPATVADLPLLVAAQQDKPILFNGAPIISGAISGTVVINFHQYLSNGMPNNSRVGNVTINHHVSPSAPAINHDIEENEE